MLAKNEILEGLNQFYGTEAYHRTIIPNVIMTDGVKYVAESCEAFWLIDFIAAYSIQLRTDGITGVVIKVTRHDRQVKIVGINMYTDHVEFSKEDILSDFPLEEITFYMVDNQSSWIMALPSED